MPSKCRLHARLEELALRRYVLFELLPPRRTSSSLGISGRGIEFWSRHDGILYFWHSSKQLCVSSASPSGNKPHNPAQRPSGLDIAIGIQIKTAAALSSHQLLFLSSEVGGSETVNIRVWTLGLVGDRHRLWRAITRGSLGCYAPLPPHHLVCVEKLTLPYLTLPYPPTGLRGGVWLDHKVVRWM